MNQTIRRQLKPEKQQMMIEQLYLKGLHKL